MAAKHWAVTRKDNNLIIQVKYLKRVRKKIFYPQSETVGGEAAVNGKALSGNV